MRIFVGCAGVCLLLISSISLAAVVAEPNGPHYRFTSHHQIRIDATPQQVWPHLLAFGSWMTDFAMTHEAGELGEEGASYRLYDGQDFLMQLVKVVPGQLLVMANLPSRFRDEYSTGVGVITLTMQGNATLVTMVMSRRYSYEGNGENPSEALRASSEWAEQTRQMWEDRFLQTLKQNVENRTD